MINITSNIQELANKLLVISNTPAFLYHSLRDSVLILDLSNTINSKDLIELINQLAHNARKTRDELIYLYIYLVCLSYKNDFDSSLLTKLNFPWAEWYKHFVSYIQMNNNVDKSLKIEMDNIETISDNPKIIEATTVYKTINLKGEHTNEV